jgi:hypothetical protein
VHAVDTQRGVPPRQHPRVGVQRRLRHRVRRERAGGPPARRRRRRAGLQVPRERGPYRVHPRLAQLRAPGSSRSRLSASSPKSCTAPPSIGILCMIVTSSYQRKGIDLVTTLSRPSSEEALAETTGFSFRKSILPGLSVITYKTHSRYISYAYNIKNQYINLFNT